MLKTARFFVLMALTMATIAGAAETDCGTAGGLVPGGSVNAQAAFTTGAGFITVTLTNGLANPTSAGQLINAVAFTLSEGQTAGTLGNSSANLRKVQSGGAFVDLGPTHTGWALAENLNGGLELCVLCTDLGGSGPSRLLIGAPSASGNYTSANGSIGGNKPHNPFTAGTAVFFINAPAVTPQTTVTGATFFFGTQAGVSVSGSCMSAGTPPIVGRLFSGKIQRHFAS